MRTSLVALALTISALTASAASAVTVVVNHVYSPSSILVGNIAGETLASPFSLGVGDTLDVTMTFTGGATITATAEDGLWMLLTTPGMSGSLETSGTLEFLGASANVVAGPIALSQQNSFIHVGSYYTSGNYRLDGAPITFTGLRQIITINSDDIGAPRDYTRIALTYFAGSVGSNVPEPATWLLMIGGFGLVGVSARRRRTAVAA